MAGLDEAGSLAIYGPLIEGTLGNARALGIRAALTGTDDPRRHRHAGGPSRDLARARPGRPRSVRAPRRSARSSWPRAGAPWHRRSRRRCAIALASALQAAARTGTIASHGSQHRGQVRGPPGGPFRAPLDPRQGAPAGTPAVRPVPGAQAVRSTTLRGPEVAPLARASSRLARDPAGRRPANRPSGRPRPSVTMELGQVRANRDGPPPGATSAPWRG